MGQTPPFPLVPGLLPVFPLQREGIRWNGSGLELCILSELGSFHAEMSLPLRSTRDGHLHPKLHLPVQINVKCLTLKGVFLSRRTFTTRGLV